jgi:hypothetical protein
MPKTQFSYPRIKQILFNPERWNWYFQAIQKSHEKCKMLKRSRINFEMLKKKKQVYLFRSFKNDKLGDEKNRIAKKNK